MDNWNDENKGYESTYAEQPCQQQNYPPPGQVQQPYPPQPYPPLPPCKKKTKLWIGIISAIVVAVVIVAVVFIFLYSSQSPLVGIWHFTKEKTTDNEGNTHYTTLDLYMVFNSTGSGYELSRGFYGSSYTESFTWKDEGNNKVKFTFTQGSMSTTVEVAYHIEGNQISLTATDAQGTSTIYGERVNSIPSSSPLVASLNYDGFDSNPSEGFVNITVSMSSPTSAQWSDVTLSINGTSGTLTGPTGNYINGYIVDIMDMDGSGTLSDGDIIYIHNAGHSLSGADISLSINGYSGYAEIYIP